MQQIRDILENHPEFTSVEWSKKSIEVCPFEFEQGPIGRSKKTHSFHNEDDNHIRLFVNAGTKYISLILVIEQNAANNREQTVLAKTENATVLLNAMLSTANLLNQRFKISQEYKRQISELQYNISSGTNVVFQSLKEGHKTTKEQIWKRF